MGVGLALARTGIRGRKAALAGLALVVASGVGVSLASLEAATRTERAYPSYLRRSDVAHLVVNPSLATARAEELIATTPGVVTFTSDDFLIATIDDGAPRSQRDVDAGTVQMRMSPNGRYTEQDRPVVLEGRMVRSGREAFLSRETAEELDANVGDVIPIAFWTPSYNTPGVGPGRDDKVVPVGRSTARVVGIGVFADEVLIDALYPRQRMVVTPEVGEEVTCTLGSVERDDPRSFAELVPVIVPEGCALSYRYFSLRVEGGDAGVAGVLDELQSRFNAENEKLPTVMREQDIGYIVIPSVTRDEAERVEGSLRPSVTALRLFALAAGLSTVVVATLGAVRFARREQPAVAVWQQLGVTRSLRLVGLAAPLLMSCAVGLAGAMVLGLAASPLGPVGSAQSVEPVSRAGLSGEVVATVVGPAVLLLLLGTVVAAASVTLWHGGQGSRRPSLVSRIALRTHPARALGLRAAARGNGSGAVLAGSVTAVGVVVASLVFSGSLRGLIDKPSHYGWPFDVGVMVGFGYGGADADAIERSLDQPEVVDWGMASLGSVSIEGESLPGIGALGGFASLGLEMVEGTLPSADDEIALGQQSAAALGLAVGDEVKLSAYSVERSAVVTGTVVLPAIGPFESDRAASGTGALMPEPFFRALVAEGEMAQGLPPGSFAELGLGAFIAIDLVDGTDPAAFLAGLESELPAWDSNDFGALTYAAPVRPSTIADVAGMRRVPLALGGFLALAMAAGLGVAIAVATRARRTELALLGAIGCSPRQLASSVRWHALAVVGTAVVVGGPLGVALGRTLYRRFATDLGVVPHVVISAVWLAGVVVAAAAVGLLAALLPAYTAARRRPAAVLRQQ